MATTMEQPSAVGFPDSPLDPDDVAYPCKGCGNVCFGPLSWSSRCTVRASKTDAALQILEEGKAFELGKSTASRPQPNLFFGARDPNRPVQQWLTDSFPAAGLRWHIECFSCNTCGTLLDSDANLLILGDGSLICNACTYSCSACGQKIEDLAILTGDQAYCAGCFRCRNCKRKIENLRYARTSQGMFCMDCHEGLMARRRKKKTSAAAAAAAQRKQSSGSSGNMHLDKSLPSLPPNIGGRVEEPQPMELMGSLPPSRPSVSSRSATRDRSPAPSEGSAKGKFLPSAFAIVRNPNVAH